MPGRTNLDGLAINAGALKKIAAQTTSGTAGTRSTHAHGLTSFAGQALVPNVAIPVPTQPNADGALASAPVVYVVAIDATNVTVRSNVASATFDLYVG